MKLSAAVERYVAHKRAEGRSFISAERILALFLRDVGTEDLEGLTTEGITRFLHGARRSPTTRLNVFGAVKCFVEFCIARGLLKALPLQPPPRPIGRPMPYIYTATEIRTLLAACEPQHKNANIDGRTLHLILTTIYATGATIDEVMTIRCTGVDLRKRTLTFKSGRSRESRSIPICKDLRRLFSEHMRRDDTFNHPHGLLFLGSDGREIRRHYVYERFRALHRLAGLPRRAKGRLLDLRYAFAVHRISGWIRQGADLNILLPALSTYMGYRTLTAAEQYLAFSPERFKSDLAKLSPAKGRRHWRDDPNLMLALAAL